jgi:hypothetical protein
MEDAHHHAAPTKSRPLNTGYFCCGDLQNISFTPANYEICVMYEREHKLGSVSTRHETDVCRAMNDILIFRGMHKNFMI